MLKPKTAAPDERSAARTALAETIERLKTLRKELVANKETEETAFQTVCAIGRDIEAWGENYPITREEIETKRVALAKLEQEREEARRTRSLLKETVSDIERGIHYAQGAIESRVTDVVRDEVPVAALVQEYRIIADQFAARQAEIYALLSLADIRGDRMPQDLISWNTPPNFGDQSRCAVWRAWGATLATDPDAPAPTPV
jgi:chromosome segregation ATPase